MRHFRRVSLALATAVATLTIPALAAPAHAATSEVQLTTSYAKAVAYWGWRDDRLDPVGLSVQDIKADGYGVGIQLVTVDTDGGRRSWTMHTAMEGKGTGMNRVTFADTAGFPEQAWINVCKIKRGVWYECRESRVTKTTIDDSDALS
ncbi:hypothetical protein [Streptomyces sp. NPDC054849]